VSKAGKNTLVLVAILAFAACAAVVVHLLTREPWYRRDLYKARALLKQEQYDNALGLLEKIAAHNEPVPERATAKFLLGQYYCSSDPNRSLKWLTAAWDETRNETERYKCGAMMAGLLFQVGRFDVLERALSAMEKMPDYSSDMEYYQRIISQSNARLSPNFFLRHTEFGLDKSEIMSASFTKDDYSRWMFQHVFWLLAKRLKKQTPGGTALAIMDWAGRNLPSLPEDKNKDFSNGPYNCAILGHATPIERAWARLSSTMLLAFFSISRICWMIFSMIGPGIILRYGKFPKRRRRLWRRKNFAAGKVC